MSDISIKTVFMGTPDFSVYIAQSLKNNGFDVAAVVTQPDKEAGRGKQLRKSPVKIWAEENDIKILQPERARDVSFIQEIADIAPQLIVTAAFGQIIPKEILDIPEYGCVNIHASLLPKYRGASPIQQALLNGDEKTGITLMYMNEKMDEGDIIFSKEISILPDDNAGSLFDRLAALGADVIADYAKLLSSGKPCGVQQKHENATYCSKIQKEQGNINWNDNCKSIENLIRALTPSPGAYSFLNKKRIKFISVKAEECDHSLPCGNVIIKNKASFGVTCGNGVLWVEALQPEGKSVQLAKDFINGGRINAESIFEKISN